VRAFGEHYRIRRIEKTDLREIIQSERASAKWAAVASHARKRNEKREVSHSCLVLNEARRRAFYSRCDIYETSTLRDDG
jgi:hypothetical protein